MEIDSRESVSVYINEIISRYLYEIDSRAKLIYMKLFR